MLHPRQTRGGPSTRGPGEVEGSPPPSTEFRTGSDPPIPSARGGPSPILPRRLQDEWSRGTLWDRNRRFPGTSERESRHSEQGSEDFLSGVLSGRVIRRGPVHVKILYKNQRCVTPYPSDNDCSHSPSTPRQVQEGPYPVGECRLLVHRGSQSPHLRLRGTGLPRCRPRCPPLFLFPLLSSPRLSSGRRRHDPEDLSSSPARPGSPRRPVSMGGSRDPGRRPRKPGVISTGTHRNPEPSWTSVVCPTSGRSQEPTTECQTSSGGLVGHRSPSWDT